MKLNKNAPVVSRAFFTFSCVLCFFSFSVSTVATLHLNFAFRVLVVSKFCLLLDSNLDDDMLASPEVLDIIESAESKYISYVICSKTC